MADQDKVTEMAELLSKGQPAAADLVAASEMLIELLTKIESLEDRIFYGHS